jgi:hypothetical protein
VVQLGAQWRSFWQYYGRARGLWRELLAACVCLAVGLLLMPCLIYAVGRAVLGPYARGNLFALWHDFLDGLASGSQAAWFILLGPYVLLWLLRAARRLLHKTAASAGP